MSSIESISDSDDEAIFAESIKMTGLERPRFTFNSNDERCICSTLKTADTFELSAWQAFRGDCEELKSNGTGRCPRLPRKTKVARCTKWRGEGDLTACEFEHHSSDTSWYIRNYRAARARTATIDSRGARNVANRRKLVGARKSFDINSTQCGSHEDRIPPAEVATVEKQSKIEAPLEDVVLNEAGGYFDPMANPRLYREATIDQLVEKVLGHRMQTPKRQDSQQTRPRRVESPISGETDRGASSDDVHVTKSRDVNSTKSQPPTSKIDLVRRFTLAELGHPNVGPFSFKVATGGCDNDGDLVDVSPPVNAGMQGRQLRGKERIYRLRRERNSLAEQAQENETILSIEKANHPFLMEQRSKFVSLPAVQESVRPNAKSFGRGAAPQSTRTESVPDARPKRRQRGLLGNNLTKACDEQHGIDREASDILDVIYNNSGGYFGSCYESGNVADVARRVGQVGLVDYSDAARRIGQMGFVDASASYWTVHSKN